MDKYTRVFELKKNLYKEGAPVLVEAGALLKNNETLDIVAQLKFRNIEGTIRAITVHLWLYDTAGSMSGELEYQYLDMNLMTNAEIGSKYPIYISDPRIRIFDVSVTEVVFADRQIWKSETIKWSPVDAPVGLAEYFGNKALADEYKLIIGKESIYVPRALMDIWICTCGNIEKKHTTRCSRCQAEFSMLQETTDKVFLSDHLYERLRIKQTQKKEQKQKLIKDDEK